MPPFIAPSICLLYIVMYLPKYQDSLRKMKEAGYEIIGYARKSKGEKDDMKRISLLNLIVEKLKTRSLADRVFISPNSSAGDPFNKRDENKREELMSHIAASGDTQDMSRYISDKKKKVIPVAIDYAGLSTNCEDMKSFLKTYPSIKEIVIDLLPTQNKAKMYTSQELLNDEKKLILKEFECRKRCIQRSK